jgi:hypothetical protein
MCLNIPLEPEQEVPGVLFWLGGRNMALLWRKSTAACPTYGACYVCFGSGPVNMHYQVCKQKDHIYKTWVTDKDRIIVDAEYVSRFFGTTHLIAKVDRTHNGQKYKEQKVLIEDIKDFVNKRWHRRADQMDLYKDGTWDLFREGMTTKDCNGQCKRPRRWEVRLLIIEQNELYNGPEQVIEQQLDNRSVLDG